MSYLRTEDTCSLFSWLLLPGHSGFVNFWEYTGKVAFFSSTGLPGELSHFKMELPGKTNIHILSHYHFKSKVPEISHFPLQICSPPVLCVLRPVYTTSTGPQALWLWVRLGQWGTSKEIRERRVKTHIYFSGSLTEQLTQAGWDLYMERSFLRSFMLDNSLSSWLLVSPPPLLCY